MTEKLYWKNPYDEEFEAEIIGIKQDGVILDRTLFYPEGGGQPADTGFFATSAGSDGTELRVEEVLSVDGVILHKVAGAVNSIDKGALVHGRIDYQRRMAHARHHFQVEARLPGDRARQSWSRQER